MFAEMDKRAHALGGALLALFFAHLVAPMARRRILAAFLGLVVAMLAGRFKETIWDKAMGLGVPDDRDALATYLGGLAGALASLVPALPWGVR